MAGLTSAPPSAGLRLVTGLRELAPGCDLILCDVWGVLHNGLRAHAEAGDALTRFRAGGGRVVLVSNAPRPAAAVQAQLDRLGVPRTAYDAILTSGDLTRQEVERRRDEVLHHLGPERDRPIFEGLDLTFGGLDQADYVVCTGLFVDDRESVEDYRDTLAVMRRRSLPMVCANPDLVVERGHQLLPCAGALAAAYEALGGEVFYAGKPHRPVYDRALAMGAELAARPIARERVLAVGDAIRTDIAGAAGAGIASLLVARGIHGGDLIRDGALAASAHVQDWVERQEARPDAVTEALVWG